jgi:hypothetical protein
MIGTVLFRRGRVIVGAVKRFIENRRKFLLAELPRFRARQ